ncbi:MAG: ribosome maturation factor RimM [Acidimicrobiia bacterium]
MPPPSPLLEIGRVTKPHGLRGEVIVHLTTDRLERVAPGSVLASPKGELRVEASRPHQRDWIVSFAGYTDRTGVEPLRGLVLSAPPLEGEDEELWVHELIGSVVVTADGVEHGRVASVEANPASDLLVLDDGRLVPLTFLVERSGDRLVVDVPAGLLDDDV